MRYFFVFQNKSYHEEYRGGYLWAPQYASTGRRVSHWENMKSIARGDVIIHSYKKQIMAVSIAKRDVYAAQRPTELSDEWQQEGWRVDCVYFPFSNSIITSDYMSALLELQPKNNAPFNRLGRGNTGYLFEANKTMYEFLINTIALKQEDEREKKRVYELLNLGFEKDHEIADVELEMKVEEIRAKQLSSEQLVEKIQQQDTLKKTQKTKLTVYYRSPYIKEMVKRIAEGKCQMCGEEAPFYDKNHEPYLEEHHVKRLANGGSDTIDNVVAICPNCHRKIHVLNDKTDTITLAEIARQNEIQYRRVLAYKKEMDKIN